MIIFKRIADSRIAEIGRNNLLRYHTLTREEVYTTSSMMASLDNKEVKICAIVNMIHLSFFTQVNLYKVEFQSFQMLKSCGSNSNFQVDTVIADVHGTDLEVLFKSFLILNNPFDKPKIFHRP